MKANEKAEHVFLPVTRYFDPEEYTEIKDDKQIREIASITNCIKINPETNEPYESKYFIYNTELELVHKGEYRFLIRNDQPYLNKTMFKKEMTALLKEIKEDKHAASILSYKVFGGKVKQLSKFKDVPYKKLKKLWEESLKEKEI